MNDARQEINFEVDYLDGEGFQPVSEERVREVLSRSYLDINILIKAMKEGQKVSTCVGTIYRIKE